MTKIILEGVEENIITRKELPLEKAREILKDEIIAVIYYGAQGSGYALNLRDNGFGVIVGQEEGGEAWDKAVSDGWIPAETLFGTEEACRRASIILYLVPYGEQTKIWPSVGKHITSGKTLCFPHGFTVAYKEYTGISIPEDTDVMLVSPKCPASLLRSLFLGGKGFGSSFAVARDSTGKASEKAASIGMGIGSSYLFETDFEHEAYSDLTGERGTLMGAIQGLFAAQYQVLRENGHSPLEAYSGTVEEFTQSLMPLVAENGMEHMYAVCSASAQRGALDWWRKFRNATLPVFKSLYSQVASGNEARRIIDCSNKPDCSEKLGAELRELRESEMWLTGEAVRSLRPENAGKPV